MRPFLRAVSLAVLHVLVLASADLGAQTTDKIRGVVIGSQPTGEMIVQLPETAPVSVGDRVQFFAAEEEQAQEAIGTGEISDVAEAMLIVRVTSGTPVLGSTAVVESHTQALGLTADDLTHLGQELVRLERRLSSTSPELIAAFDALAAYTAGGPPPGAPTDEAGASIAFVLVRTIREQESLGWELQTTLTRMGALDMDDGSLDTSCRFFTGDPPVPPAQTEAAVDLRLRTPIRERGSALLAAWRLLEAEGPGRLRRFAASRLSYDDNPTGAELVLESFDRYLQGLAEAAPEFIRDKRAVGAALEGLVGAFEDPTSGASKRACEAAIRSVFDFSRAVGSMAHEATGVADYLR